MPRQSQSTWRGQKPSADSTKLGHLGLVKYICALTRVETAIETDEKCVRRRQLNLMERVPEDIPYRAGVPAAAALRPDLPPVEYVGDLPERPSPRVRLLDPSDSV